MKVGDIVRVARQPSDLFPSIEGNVGFVEELQGAYARIITLHADGTGAGGGSVPIACLEIEVSPVWASAKRIYDDVFARGLEESLARGRRYKDALSRIAGRHGLTTEMVAAIERELAEAHGRDWWPPIAEQRKTI